MMTAKKIPDALDRTKGKAYQKLKEFGYPAFVSDTIDKALMIKYTERIQTVSTFLKCLGLADDQNIPKDQKAWLTKYVHKVPEPQPSATKRYIQILQVGKAEVKYDLPDNKGITYFPISSATSTGLSCSLSMIQGAMARTAMPQAPMNISAW